MTLVVDVSQFGGVPDFRWLHAKGARGVIVRTSSGPTGVDELAEEQIAAAREASIVVLAGYHYNYSWRPGDAQAEHALEVADRLGVPAVVPDFERVATGQRPEDEPHIARVTALAYIRRAHRLTGRKVPAYGPAFYLRDLRLEGDEPGALWLADTRPSPPAPFLPPPWSAIALWQYEHNAAGGAPGTVVDWNRTDLSLEQLGEALAGAPLTYEILGPVVAATRAAMGLGESVQTFETKSEGPP